MAAEARLLMFGGPYMIADAALPLGSNLSGTKQAFGVATLALSLSYQDRLSSLYVPGLPVSNLTVLPSGSRPKSVNPVTNRRRCDHHCELALPVGSIRPDQGSRPTSTASLAHSPLLFLLPQ